MWVYETDNANIAKQSLKKNISSLFDKSFSILAILIKYNFKKNSITVINLAGPENHNICSCFL